MAVSTMSTSSSHVVRRPRSELQAKMTCPLCNKLFEEATTISECLHTFCKKCIYEKIVDEEVDCCPKCNAHLGVAPLEKLRPDNNWRNLIASIFPSEQRKVEDQEVAPVSVPPKRKERLISSLVTDTPGASRRSETHRRKRYPTRRIIPPPDCTQSVEKHERKEEDFRERLPETPKNAPSTPQNCEEGSSMQHMLRNGVLDGKPDLFNPSNRLVEPAKTGTDIPVAKPVLPDLPSIERLEIREAEDDGNEKESIPAPSGSRPLRKSQRGRKKEAVVADVNTPAKSVVAANTKSGITGVGFWFSLVASNQNGHATLPQIPSGYLRVKDGSLPVSSIKRYLATKLNLTSEAEVEIFLRGQPVIPTLQLHNLADLWVRTTPASQRVLQGSVGSSGKDYVMILTYARKSQFR